MTDMPDKILADPEERWWENTDFYPGQLLTEYIRADKHDEVQCKLEDALDVINTIRLHFVAHQNNGILLRTHAAFETLVDFLHKYEELPTHD